MYKMLHKIYKKIGGRDALVVSGLGRYSLKDTLECGQVFRFERLAGDVEYPDEYLVVAKGQLINVAESTPGELIFFDMTDEVFEGIVRDYFALDYDLDMIRLDVIAHTDSEWLRSAAEYAGGIAILRQDPFETLISFIISQNNNIPRIKKIIKSIASEYGVNISLQGSEPHKCPLDPSNTTPCQEKCKNCGVCYTFPTAEQILERPEGLLPSHPGFRYSYIIDAAEKVATGEIKLDMIAAARSYTHTVECLKAIRGVGDKVAACCALFGFGNLEAFPIDVWMKRAIDTYFDGKLDPTTLGRYAGVAQQYIFHYIRSLEGNNK